MSTRGVSPHKSLHRQEVPHKSSHRNRKFHHSSSHNTGSSNRDLWQILWDLVQVLQFLLDKRLYGHALYFLQTLCVTNIDWVHIIYYSRANPRKEVTTNVLFSALSAGPSSVSDNDNFSSDFCRNCLDD